MAPPYPPGSPGTPSDEPDAEVPLRIRHRGAFTEGPEVSEPLRTNLVDFRAMQARMKAYAATTPSKRAVDPDMSWVADPEVPRPEEILDGPAPPRVDMDDYTGPTNRAQGAWQSRDEYLSTHYSLLRRETVQPLRDAVRKLKMDPGAFETDLGSTVGFYDRVHVTAVIPSTMGVAIKVVFSIQRIGKRVHWEQSKRLIQGSLVVLSPREDCFRTTCLVATVAARPLASVQQNPPEIDLFFGRSEDLIVDPSIEYIMIEERQSYFEATRHTLVALQRMQHEEFPLSQYLIDARPVVESPTYRQAKPIVDLRTLMSNDEQKTGASHPVNILAEWPNEHARTSMDISQWRALERILTKELAIVQGPPGTGKTYVSVQAIRTLIDNMSDRDPPIIVTCQTNHALDQLLRHIAAFETRYVRLGGRSKDVEVVKKRTLYQVRCGMDLPRYLSGPFLAARKELEALAGDIALILEPIKLGSGCMVDVEFLRKFGILSDEQCHSLRQGETEWVSAGQSSTRSSNAGPVGSWLGGKLTTQRKSFTRDDLGFEFEEAELEFEQLRELEAETYAIDDEDFESLKGTIISIHNNFTAKDYVKLTDEECEQRLQNADLYQIRLTERPSVFNFMQRQVMKKVTELFRVKASAYDQVARRRRQATYERDVPILAQQKVIGMTTTGFSKYRAMVAAINPKIVLIEEAAETLEAPLIAACVPSVEHLILVGDHMQLRPHCNLSFHEGDPVNMNLSLFERLVNNGVEYDALRRQRRMIPEIRRILRPIYGSLIKDHESVKDPVNRPAVPGMGGCNTFFYTHTHPETRDDYMSAVNELEAQMVVGFYEYLWMNGMDSTKITILTFYNGQRKRIIRLLRQRCNLRNLKHNVVTVDSYQGEENDVVLLSLVRSNDAGSIGFLSVDNRVCVAISRARRGFYLFGNAELLASESFTWGEICEIMYFQAQALGTIPKSRIGYWLPMTCKNHGRKVFLEHPDDWVDLNGGCRSDCDVVLDCGHACQLRCHPFSHNQIICRLPCERALTCGHRCNQVCGEACRCSKCKHTNPVRSDALAIDDALGTIPLTASLAKLVTRWEDPEAARQQENVEPVANTQVGTVPQAPTRQVPVGTNEGMANSKIIQASQGALHQSLYSVAASTNFGPTPAEAVATSRGQGSTGFAKAPGALPYSPAVDQLSDLLEPRSEWEPVSEAESFYPRNPGRGRGSSNGRAVTTAVFRLKPWKPASPKLGPKVELPPTNPGPELLVDLGDDRPSGPPQAPQLSTDAEEADSAPLPPGWSLLD